MDRDEAAAMQNCAIQLRFFRRVTFAATKYGLTPLLSYNCLKATIFIWNTIAVGKKGLEELNAFLKNN